MPSSYPILRLQPEKDIHLRNRHHAIFKNAVAGFPQAQDGEIVEVQSSRGEFLCYATWNSQAYICARAIAFEHGDPLQTIRRLMERAIAMRRTLLKGEDTTAYRLINAEGDALPGLIVDQYGSTLVLQLTTMGMDKLREWILETLTELVRPAGIFEKSTGTARKKEGLEPVEGWVRGKGQDSIVVTERGLQYKIVLVGSQKTGLFLDQRDERSLVKQYAEGRTVLDCCSYVGGFSVNALAGGALFADAVDYDREALERASEHVAMNGIEGARFSAHPGDVFEFLRRRPLPRTYDFIILDPPAFAKRSSDLDQAKKAYTDMNRLAFEMLAPGGLLLTCSCSYQMDSALFQTIVFHAARQAKRSGKIIQRHRQAVDHPVNIYHPETDYLKSLLLWVE
jgi:23S rRNA (cytosine1962-C5)-methyltransferase